MTTYLGKSCSFGLPRVPFVNCGQFMYLVISLLVLRAGCGIWLYQFLIIAYLFTLEQDPFINFCLKIIEPYGSAAVVKAQPRGQFGRNSLPKLADFSLCWAEGEVKMYRTYREIQNLDQNFSWSPENVAKLLPVWKLQAHPCVVLKFCLTFYQLF